MRIDDSLNLSRSSGTLDYIAPESKKSGIFPPASDVYSLGEVLLRNWYFLLCYNLEMDEDLPTEIETAIKEFRLIAAKMAANDPEKRSSVRDALRSSNNLILKNYRHVKGVNLHGMGTIFTQIDNFLDREPQSKVYLHTSSITDIPMIKIK